MHRNEFQIHQQREKERQKREEADTAQVYESYIATFKGSEDGTSTDRTKTFIRGGIFNPGATTTTTSSSSSNLSSSSSSVSPTNLSSASTDNKEIYKLGKVISNPNVTEHETKPLPFGGIIPRKLLNTASTANAPSYKKPEEPTNPELIKTSTNLFVRGIPQNVDEERLFRLFSTCGPIASIKILWPRQQDDMTRVRNTGFVAYMRRDSAEKAFTELNGFVLADAELHIEWSKPVTVPAYPLALLTDTETGGLPKLRTLPFWPVTPEQLRSTQTFLSAPPPAKPSIVVTPPESEKQRFVIDYMAKIVAAKGGRKFEKAVQEAEKENPLYAFLFDKKSAGYTYYKWRVYSYTQGDTEHKWSKEPFQMYMDGPWWLPPPPPPHSLSSSSSSTSGSESSGSSSKVPLSAIGVRRLGKLLDNLTISNSKICQAMGFALDHASSAEQVVKVVADSFAALNISAPLMIARLFLVSDILYNSSSPAKGAYAYKPLLQEALPGIFRCLALFYNSLQGRLTAMHFKDQVERVVYVWEQWSLFPQEFTASLRGAFEQKSSSGTAASLKRPADFADSNVPLKK